ncbi:NAD(P)-dependent oxidoreductase [Leptolyngbya boryana CZ1]|uniref:NAD(P)-dependent oxidoreductase n=1 Tax=Leptolyngbya boryana CZ1 TaxID=3060204 RepID=A0AA97AM99_LEPBY|nr:NAD(P)-dependent oxidoreductase [Leptolyngbya boryana]WNZ43987.1 NAD(P)-dependent oxidoreductase [Leptolyngbya boryana CZ1]
MVNILVLGCGEVALLAHLPALKNLQSQGVLEIAGVCDTDLEKAKTAATQFDIPIFGTDWKKMVAETGANAVSLCLPPGINAELSIQALEMGLHVICEKPPGRNVEQAECMAQAAIAHPDCVTMIAFNRRHAPLYLHSLKQSLKFARPHLFYGRFTRSSMGNAPSNTMTDWLTSDGSHTLDLAIATIGFPERVAVSRRQVGSELDNVWTIQLHAEQGTAILLFDFTTNRRVERFEWTGPGYDVVLELPEKAEWSYAGAAVQPLLATELTGSDEFAVNYGFVGEYSDFVAAIAGTQPRPEADFIYGAAFMGLIKTLLEATSGEIYPVIQPQVQVLDREEITLDRVHQATCGKSVRPVVQIMQPPAGQSRFFQLAQLSKLAEQCEVRLASSDPNQPIHLDDVNVLITGWAAHPLDSEAIVEAANLKLAIVIGASVNALQPEQLFRRNILVCNTADAIAQSVAEHCLMTTLVGLRRLTEVNHRLHQGGWITPAVPRTLGYRIRKSSPVTLLKPLLLPLLIRLIALRQAMSADIPVSTPPPPPAKWHDLQGQIVGLIGWGHTARHFANLLRPFHCKLLIYSEAISSAELAEYNARRASLAELLGSAKVISLHKGLTGQSKGMIGTAELALIKPNSVLVNTARSGLIDEMALIERLKKGDIVAALDVFDPEPLPEVHPLREFENVILSPHNASTTPECDLRVGEQALDLVLDWLEGKPIQTIGRDRLAKMT